MLTMTKLANSMKNYLMRVLFKYKSKKLKNFIYKEMISWFELMLPKELLIGLYEKGFYSPMPIQKLVIPEAIKNRSNIIGTAQTVF